MEQRGQRKWVMLSVALALVCFFVTTVSASDVVPLHFAHIGREKGLTTDIITALYQDRAGFVWIGSRDGLRVYDGYSFQFFDHDISNPQSLADNAIRTMYEDSHGRFWVGTNAGGFELLDRSTGKFRHFRHDSGDLNSLSHDSVYAIVEDTDGSIWVGTQQGLNRLNPATLKFERILADSKNPKALSNDYISGLHIDRGGALWVATVGGGLCRRDPRTGQFTVFRHDPNDKRTISSDRVFAIAEDSRGRLWLGTEKGVVEFEAESGVLRRFEHVSAKSGLSDNTVTSLAWSPRGTLWVGTLDGLDEIDADGRIIRHEDERKDKDKDSIRDFRVIALLVDREARLWAGTWGTGLGRANLSHGPFEIVSASPHGLSGRDVTEILHDRSGRLWVGTTGGGLNRRDRDGSSFYQYSPESGKAVLAVFEARDRAIWVGTYQGLERIAPDTGKVSKFVHDPANPDSLGLGYVTDIVQDRDGKLWVGTGGSGLQRLNPDGHSFEHFTHSASDPATLSDDFVTVLHESKDGMLWVGTRSGGLNECDRVALRCRRHLPGDGNSIGHHYVTSIYEDGDGRLWIGTAGGGLNMLDTTGNPNRHFAHFTNRDGLPDNNVMSIAEDDGRLWLGTRHGLALFNPSSREVINYSVEDGLPIDEFNNSAAARDEGHIYFGTPAGLLTIPRGLKLQPALGSPTALTAIRTLKGTVQSTLPVPSAEQIKIPYGTIISFEAAVLDFAEASEHRYEYRLKGLSDQWIDLGSRRGMTFSDLSPGRYTLEIKGRNGRGVWSSAAPVRLQVVPPVWMRTWFRALVVLVFAGLIIGLHRFRTAALQRRNRQLVNLQTQREQALREVQQSEEALQAAYGRLQALTRRIEAVAEEERRRIAHELHDEMGQALTAAKINLQLLPAPSDSEARIKRIADTVNLVDNMISRVRAISMDLRPPLLYELGLMPALRAYAETQARRSGLEIVIDTPPLEYRLSTEIEIAAFRVMQEAMTNIIRHAHATRVELRLELRDSVLELEIHDNGIGFDIQSVQSRTEAGHGHLGLSGIRERVELLGGDAVIQSGDGGTTITVGIPAVPAGEEVCG